MDPISFLFWRFYYFFRDPKREIPSGKVIVAPADGYIIYIKEVLKGEHPVPEKKGVCLSLEEWLGTKVFEGEGYLVGIYMTPLSVHFNRAPIAGLIKKVISKPAEHENFSMAKVMMRLFWGMKPYEEGSRYITKNARNTTVIEGDFPVATIQIADRYVNQVDSFVKEGQRVEKGQKIGMIRMGSQCDLFLPKNGKLQLKCAVGDKVFAGKSILAEYE